MSCRDQGRLTAQLQLYSLTSGLEAAGPLMQHAR